MQAATDTSTLLLAGDVMTGRGIDQAMAHPAPRGRPSASEAGRMGADRASAGPRDAAPQARVCP